MTIGRDFSLAPYFMRYPTMSLSTPVSTPSVLEVHVNGRLVRQEQVQPGRIDVRNLPLSSGQNDTRLVLRDPFGGTREITSGFYVTSSVLARGIHDYQYTIGWRRQSLGTASFDYREPVAIARHRMGLSNAVTAGFRVEGGRDLVSAGPSVNMRLPIGELELAAGASRTLQQWGTAAQPVVHVRWPAGQLWWSSDTHRGRVLEHQSSSRPAASHADRSTSSAVSRWAAGRRSRFSTTNRTAPTP